MLFQSKYTVQCSLGQSFTGQRSLSRTALSLVDSTQSPLFSRSFFLIDYFLTVYFYLFVNLLKTCLLIIICNVGLQYCVDSALSWTARSLTHWCPWQRSALLLGTAESRKMQINLQIKKICKIDSSVKNEAICLCK